MWITLGICKYLEESYQSFYINLSVILSMCFIQYQNTKTQTQLIDQNIQYKHTTYLSQNAVRRYPPSEKCCIKPCQSINQNILFH